MKKYEFKEYDPAFPLYFEEEKNRLKHYLSEDYQIEHIGSSAVPNLGGKGIIDIMIAVPQEKMESLSQQAQKAGYLWRPLASTKDRLFLRQEYPADFRNEKVYHLHITHPNSSDWKEAIAFRDYLSTHPEDLRRYEEIKRKAADEADESSEKYGSIKESILREILGKAYN